jgi:hypothetical protein
VTRTPKRVVGGNPRPRTMKPLKEDSQEFGYVAIITRLGKGWARVV